ncbi:MAG: Gfo/Idh/MocA family oxidoreductase [Lachnospiraceae bacterium]|nr:Gfo/Idh/MocA family oxidoreductase [Lachnospiraceae bacterium]
MKLKIAVIGTGIIGGNHLRAIAKSESAELCALCDVNEAVVAPLAEKYEVPYFTNYKEIVEKTDAEAVILNLPHWLHCEVTEFFLNHGLHVLVEKPMANTVAECDRMILAAERSGKKLAVGHVQRYYGALRKVKEIYQSKELGELCMYTEMRSGDFFAPERPKWFLDKALSGGGMVMNIGAHVLDKLFYVLECEPMQVFATYDNVKNDCSIESHGQIHIRFENKVSANITLNGCGNCGSENVFYFSEGAIKIAGGKRMSKNVGNGWEEVPLETKDDPFFQQLEEFCKLVKDEPSEIVTADYGRRVIKTIERIYDCK